MSELVPKPKRRPSDRQFQTAVLKIRDAADEVSAAASILSSQETGYRNFEPTDDAIRKLSDLYHKFYSMLVWEHEI